MSDNTDLAYHARLARLQELRKNYKVFFWKPYSKQREFHAAGLKYRERLLMAGNQLGKTLCAGNETSMHVTGVYPDDWAGKRMESANRGWVCGPTAELTRDGAQRVLMGPIGSWGTGTIPKELIIDIKRSRGTPDAIETVLVKHLPTGGVSQITFKAYSDGREAFQSETLDWVWFDEEPPPDIYTEGVTRTNVTTGPVYLTFTPLMGMSNVVMRFLDGVHPDRHVTNMTIDDVEHYTPEQKATIIASYPEHERDARTKGVPMLGEGRVFQLVEDILKEDPIVFIPSHWKQMGALDIGGNDHPTAAVHLLIEPQDDKNDVIHVHRCYRKNKEIPLIHAAAIKPWGAWLPWAWPKDALQHDKGGSCEQISKQYKDHGLAMLAEYAQYPDKRGNGVEAGIIEMTEMMRTNRFKVNRNLSEWFDEFRMYHRKDGQIVKERDDLMSATRYGVMMRRFALPEQYAPKPPDKYAKNRSKSGTTWMSG